MDSVFTHRTSDVLINENVTFDTLISNPLLLKGLNQSGYRKPSPIQLKALPLGRLGLDLVAQAKSGTGKTIVFSVISLEAVNLHVNFPQVLVLAPTREIAVQIKEVMTAVASFIEGLQVQVFIGGLPISEDLSKLRNCHIAVGTPGRVQALIQAGSFPTHALKLFVLDEADKLMEDVFFVQIEVIYKSLPQTKQSMAFSATYDNGLLEKINRFVHMPQYVMLCSETPSLEGWVQQYYEVVSSDGDSNAIQKFAAYKGKFRRLEELLSKVPFYQCIIFLNHRGRAVELSENLTRKGWPALYISGGLNQRERLATLSKARNFQLRVLVCSDLIARGVDIERVDLVVNLDMPRDPETYFHRVGRTGRFGTRGLAVSFIDQNEVTAIQRLQQTYAVKLQQLPGIDSHYA
ncbi:DEAD-domain-containing protein [Basidiobolus meristosporus CBS 931.73]|uniref:RNA helicase n=1 Tax=Basidiobolus meristosporus CBS 931.73 TaxID=1314790 RepID=A0A1Y1XXT5_9FUNG|nr:DEAD-domain-containing protein [Basidiobolus meristosporus CBS 931.73]|eukprot:ORX90563.1 DEAD-domain-containing protein [Basidiobolus meristosporus CBS 931.73]